MLVTITKTGFRCTDWNAAAQAFTEVPVESYIQQLRSGCRIEEGATLRDIFSAVAADKELEALISYYSWCDGNAFHEESLKNPTDNRQKLFHIEIRKYFEYGSRAGSDASLFCDVAGVGERDLHGCDRYALDLCPVNDIADLPVKLNETMLILKNHEAADESQCVFSLLEVLDALYFEIGFHGNPHERDEVMAGLERQIEEINNGTAKLYSMDDVFGKEPL